VAMSGSPGLKSTFILRVSPKNEPFAFYSQESRANQRILFDSQYVGIVQYIEFHKFVMPTT